VGAILKILCPRERRVFQSKLGVSSSKQCNLTPLSTYRALRKKNKKGYNLFRTPCISAFCWCIEDILYETMHGMESLKILSELLAADLDLMQGKAWNKLT
jgi:hypothetical protein